MMESAGPIGGADAARGDELHDGHFEFTDPLYPDVGSPAGGGYATAADLHRFIEALLGHALLNEQNTALLLNGFEGPAEGGILPEEFSFAGGAPGINAILLSRTAERETVILMGTSAGLRVMRSRVGYGRFLRNRPRAPAAAGA
jgi:CubicO group peptidase (beta-lactamase class C family)